jgi:hypothetical protein
VKLVALMLVTSTAIADPIEPRVITAPTAWLAPAGGFVASTGLDMRGEATLDGDYGLGRIGEVELGVDSDARACESAPCGTDDGEALAKPLHLVRAAFRIGSPEGEWLPAVVFGVRETIDAGDMHAIGEAYAVASRELGPLRVHAGIDLLASSIAAARVFPLGGIEYRPPRFRKTSLIADVAWQPIFGEAIQCERIFAIGARYQTFRWLSVELDYRAREDESLAGSTVLARVIVAR